MNGNDLIVLSDEWGGHPTSMIHLVKQLIPENRVFWINMIGRMPSLSFADLSRTRQVVGNWLNGRGSHHEPNGGETAIRPFSVSSPIMVPIFNQVGRVFNRQALKRTWLSLQKKFGVSNPVLITTAPAAVDFVRYAQGAKVVYVRVDDWSAYPGIDQKRWCVMEDELMQMADGVAYTARNLKPVEIPERSAMYLPHGVDFEHFDRANKAMLPIAEMEGIPKPIVGFFGLISEWVDLNLIAGLAKQFPSVSFVFIGDSTQDIRDLGKEPNIHFLGSIAYEKLPQFARYFDTGVIPFVANKLTHAVNPLKLWEYYALGLPVLATQLDELETLPGPLFLSRDLTSMASNLKRLLQSDLTELKNLAVSTAASNAWKCRAEKFGAFVQSLGMR